MSEPGEATCPRELLALAEPLSRGTSLSVEETRRGIRGVFSICGTDVDAQALAREFTACFAQGVSRTG